ncbi:MAG: hypothetical protein SGPRY_014384, partial [Prymnesium sp.]
GMVNEYLSLDDGSSLLPEDVAQLRKQRESIKERLDQAVNQLTPLKWVNRVIMWCADKMPSFGDTILKESSYAPVCAPNGVRTQPDPSRRLAPEPESAQLKPHPQPNPLPRANERHP